MGVGKVGGRASYERKSKSLVVALTVDTALAVLARHVGGVLRAPAVDQLEPELAVGDPLVPFERRVGAVPHQHA